MGLNTHTLIFGDNYDGYFTPGTFVYNNIELNKNGALNDSHLTLSAGALNISGNLVLTDGQLVLSTNNPTINFAGNLTIATDAIFTRGTGTLTFSGTAPATFTDQSATAQNIGNIALNKTSTTETDNKLTLASNLTCGTLSVDGTSGQSDTLDMGTNGYTLTLANVGNAADVFTLSGTLIPGTGTIRYAATNSLGNVNITPATYSSLELSGAGIYVLTANTAVSSDLTIGAASTLDTISYNLNVAGNFSNQGTFTPHTNAVTLNGTNQTLTGNTSFYNLTKTVSSPATLTFAANSTTTINAVGTLTLQGNSNSSRLALRSGTPTTSWNLDVNAAANFSFDYLDVQDSAATGKALSTLPSLDSVRNTNWTRPLAK